MPCQCNYSDYEMNLHNPPKPTSYDEMNKRLSKKNRELEDLGKTYNSLKAECDKVTQLLCYACGLIRMNKDISDKTDIRLKDWMKSHDEWDLKRTLKVFKEKFTKDTSFDDALAKFIDDAEKVHPLSFYHKTVFFNLVWDEFIRSFDTAKPKPLDKSLTEKVNMKLKQIKKLEDELKALGFGTKE